MEKRTVKKIYHVDNQTLIKARVIGIAYREKTKQRHKMLKDPPINNCIMKYTKLEIYVI